MNPSVSHQKDKEEKASTRTWLLHVRNKGEIRQLQRNIDHSLSGYSFYPEIDWGQYGYRAPEGYQVLGGWRHPKSRAFIFLLESPKIPTIRPQYSVFLHAAGDSDVIAEIEPKIKAMKAYLEVIEKKQETEVAISDRLDRIQTSKPLRVPTLILGFLTTIINVFSLYLRKLPPPSFQSNLASNFYGVLLTIIHCLSLFLLLLVILITIAFCVKWGILFIRRI